MKIKERQKIYGKVVSVFVKKLKIWVLENIHRRRKKTC